MQKPSSINGVGIIQFLLAGAFVVWLLFLPNTATRWPWAFDPFNARVMAAWPAACAVWAATMYFAEDWAKIKVGMQALILYTAALFAVWLFTNPQYNAIGTGLTYGILCGLVAGVLAFMYWRQEAARLAVAAGARDRRASRARV